MPDGVNGGDSGEAIESCPEPCVKVGEHGEHLASARGRDVVSGLENETCFFGGVVFIVVIADGGTSFTLTRLQSSQIV